MEPLVNRHNKASLTNLWVKMENWGSKYADLEVNKTPSLQTCKNQHGPVVSKSDLGGLKPSSVARV